MSSKKCRQIREKLHSLDTRLANAETYLAQGVNVEGTSFLHFDDWRGNSGHPLWVRNHMVPTTMRARARKEKALQNLVNKVKDKNLAKRRSRLADSMYLDRVI